MSTLEAALRGGAIAVLLLALGLKFRHLGTVRVSRYSAVLQLCAAAFVVESASGFETLDLRWQIPIHVFSSCAPVVFWVMTAALFDDEFKARWYHAVAGLGLAVLAWREMYGWPRSLIAAYDALALLFVLLGAWHALAGRSSDLMEWRRRIRVEYAVCVAFYIVTIIVSEWLRPGGLRVAPFSIFNAIVVLAMVFLFTVRLTGEQVVPASPPGRQTKAVRDDPPPIQSATALEAALLEALHKAMKDDKAYREEGLSIALLAQRLGVQEYRLRRLINQHLGHRNFSAFVNGFRLAEVSAALADPGQAEVPILTIALDAGFGSIGPFNRAFKAATGLTPTEYRRAHIGTEGAILSPIPESGSRS